MDSIYYYFYILYFIFWSVYWWGGERISEDKVSACFEKKIVFPSPRFTNILSLITTFVHNVSLSFYVHICIYVFFLLNCPKVNYNIMYISIDCLRTKYITKISLAFINLAIFSYSIAPIF